MKLSIVTTHKSQQITGMASMLVALSKPGSCVSLLDTVGVNPPLNLRTKQPNFDPNLLRQPTWPRKDCNGFSFSESKHLLQAFESNGTLITVNVSH